MKIKTVLLTLLFHLIVCMCSADILVDLFVIEQPQKLHLFHKKFEPIEKFSNILKSKNSKILHFVRAHMGNNGEYEYDGMRKLDFLETSGASDLREGVYLKLKSHKADGLFTLDIDYYVRDLLEWFVEDSNEILVRPIFMTRGITSSVQMPLNHYSMIGGSTSEGKHRYIYVSIRGEKGINQ